jgi:raffinose/stachyose/melibiose transport system substrate-binding protein
MPGEYYYVQALCYGSKTKGDFMKRQFISTLLALVLSLFVAAAVFASGGQDSSTEGEMSGELKVALWRDLEADPTHPAFAVHEILQQWNEMYPNVDLKYEFIGGQSVMDKFTWLTTHMLSETLPDVSMIYFPNENYYNRDYIYDLAPELDKPNPYSSNPTWRDDFPEDAQVIKNVVQPDGGVYVAGFTQSGNVGATGFVYNKDIFDEVGVDVPKTWAEFLDIQAKIKAAGYTPFLQPTAGPLGWLVDWPRWVIQWQLFDDAMDEVDIQAPFDVITQYEVVRAYKKGIFTPKDPRYKETWRMMKEWSQYWQEGFLAPPEGDAFVEGKAAMKHTMTLWIPQIAGNPDITFDWGTFYQPMITAESSRYATGVTPQRVGNSGAGASASMFFMIPQTTVKAGNLAKGLDLLKFMTSPDRLAYWCQKQTIPCFAPGTPVDKVYPGDPDSQRQMAGFFDPPAFENGSSNLNFSGIGGDTGTQLMKLLQEYLADAMSIDEVVDEIDQIIQIGVEDLLAANPDWKKDW